ncbi:anhydro-N-acetylmuramic acid kinase [Olleya sp. HaHaR_3_96]|uniref:anhydro-N-acetylmuramic acid kinase n=1 Tax=Olleya sp. HaHaR_3_96 TaxID=2745560 RepID=UPI001C4FCB79|nr:anhydro-N-acetylmuramic acid kinase [Olleya sp. HaHaR_3_96]QXP60073.1 anhydro-N-acetylmuramic acid kinase [Olleya sp. HaHaR_3_96]
MIKDVYNVIGVMSGTSLDGIDLALISFKKSTNWSFNIIAAETVSYPEHWFNKLKNLISLERSELANIDEDYTSYLATVINPFIKQNSIADIDAVCSHGHTALHQPSLGFTIQIGNLPKLSSLIDQLVICDFRVQDVDLGGQGAPLVPIGDRLLFKDYDWCLNLGGFANISSEVKNESVAFDICPVNIVLNKYVESLGFQYDDGGELARNGKLNNTLFEDLNALPFYKETPPKSLGLEWVEQQIIPLINSFELHTKDILHTYVKHAAFQIAKVVNQTNEASILVTGGGAFNTFLIEEITKLTSNKIVIPSSEIIEFKEALIFGFLGVLKLREEINCLKSVTGASQDHSSGKVYPVNYLDTL